MATTAAFVSGFPAANGQVNKAKIYKGVLYVCGQFTLLGGLVRNGFAAIDPVTDAVLPMTLVGGPPPGTNITDFVILNDVIYIIGNAFTSPRNNAAAFDLAGNLLPWNPDLGAGGGSDSIDTDGSSIYITGAFLNVNGGSVPRNYFAAFDPVTGVATAWDPDANGAGTCLKVVGSLVYLGGSFTTINGGTARNHACAVDKTTGASNAFDPDLDSTATAIESYNGRIYLAGFFTNINAGAFSRPGLAAFDPTTGACISSFNANIPGVGFNVHQFAGKLYFGGGFTFSSGQKDFAILNPTDGSLLTPNISFDSLVRDIAMLGNRIFLVGNFVTYLGTTKRTNLAAYVFGSSTLKDWAPTTNGTVRSVAYGNGRVYVGGNFTTVSGPNGTFTRNALAAFDPVTGDVLPFDPDAGIDVNTIELVGTDVYFCGVFDTIQAQPRNRAAAVDEDGVLLPWDPDLGSGPTRGFDLLFDGADLYIGGSFTVVNGGVSRNSLCKVDTATGIVDPTWDPNVTGQVQSLAFDGTWLYLGGSFTVVGGQARQNLARVSPVGVGAVDLTWIFNTGGAGVQAIALSGAGDLYAVGFFASINGTPQLGLTRITSLGVLAPGWANALAPDSTPSYAIFAPFGDIFLGSSAEHLGGQYRPGGTSSNAAGVLTGWAPKLYQALGIYSFTFNFASQTLYIGGDFSYVDVQSAGHLAAFDIPPPPVPGIPRSPAIEFLNRKTVPGGPQLTLFKWKPVFMDEQNNYITVDGYRVYRTSSLNLEDPVLIAEVTTLDIRGFIDTMFTEEIDGFFKYCVSAFNSAGEGGKSCTAGVAQAQSDRI